MCVNFDIPLPTHWTIFLCWMAAVAASAAAPVAATTHRNQPNTREWVSSIYSHSHTHSRTHTHQAPLVPCERDALSLFGSVRWFSHWMCGGGRVCACMGLHNADCSAFSHRPSVTRGLFLFCSVFVPTRNKLHTSTTTCWYIFHNIMDLRSVDGVFGVYYNRSLALLVVVPWTLHYRCNERTKRASERVSVCVCVLVVRTAVAPCAHNVFRMHCKWNIQSRREEWRMQGTEKKNLKLENIFSANVLSCCWCFHLNMGLLNCVVVCMYAASPLSKYGRHGIRKRVVHSPCVSARNTKRTGCIFVVLPLPSFALHASPWSFSSFLFGKSFREYRLHASRSVLRNICIERKKTAKEKQWVERRKSKLYRKLKKERRRESNWLGVFGIRHVVR